MILEKKARKKIILIASLIFIFLALAAYYYLLPGIASFLTVETNLPHSDVIIILGGDSERVPYGVKLYHSNYSDKIIVTGGLINLPQINTTWAELEKEEAIDMGVPQNDILLVDNSNTTFEDAQFSREIMLQNNFSSAIVVSSPYHMRRVAWIFGKVFNDDSIKLFYSPVGDSWFKPEKWWIDERRMHVIMDEYAKFVYYLFKGF